jgi:hypothetical protein
VEEAVARDESEEMKMLALKEEALEPIFGKIGDLGNSDHAPGT